MNISHSKDPKAASKRAHPAARIALALGLLFVVTILLLALVLSSGPKVVWLSPSEVSRPAHSTIFTRFKYRIAVLVWPLVHNYWHGRPSISTGATFLTLSTTAMEQTGLGTPFATNANGLRVWILSSAELTSFQERLKTIPGASILSKPRVQTADGMQAEVSTSGPTNRLDVDILPKFVSSSVKLTIGITATEVIASTPGNFSHSQTNLAAACRVLVPNGGGLVIDGGNAKDESGNTYWFIASPIAVDSKGNPVKL